MAAPMDKVASWTAFSCTSQDYITDYLSVSYYEVVEVEAKANGEKGRMRSVRVEVRKKEDGQMVALGIMWMSPPSNISAHKISKLRFLFVLLLAAVSSLASASPSEIRAELVKKVKVGLGYDTYRFRN